MLMEKIWTVTNSVTNDKIEQFQILQEQNLNLFLYYKSVYIICSIEPTKLNLNLSFGRLEFSHQHYRC